MKKGPGIAVGLAGLLVVSLLSGSRLYPQATPSAQDTDRAKIYEEIEREKLKAGHDPSYASSARKKIAQLYLEAGEYEKAIKEYRFEMVLHPSQVSILHRRIGEVYEKAGDPDAAQAEYELARLTRQKSPKSLYRQRLDQWEKEGKYSLAIQEYRFLLQTDPRLSLTYLKNIARLYALAGDAQQSRLYYQKLLEAYLQRIKRDPGRAYEYHLGLAEIYTEMGDPEKAFSEYDLAVRSNPGKEVEIIFKRARMLEKLERWPEALKVYRGLDGDRRVEASDLRAKIARVLQKMGDTDGALREYRQNAVSAGEGGAESSFKMARLYLKSGRTEEAVSALRAALPRLNALEQVRVYEDIGDIFLEAGKKVQAEESFRTASRLLQGEMSGEKADTTRLARIAELEEKAGNPEGAQRYYQKLIVALSEKCLEPGQMSARCRNKLAEVYLKLGKPEEAAKQYQEWIKLEPSNPAPCRKLARLYQDQLKDEKQAEIYSRKSHELLKAQPGRKLQSGLGN